MTIALKHVVTITLDEKKSERDRVLTMAFNYAGSGGPPMEFDSEELEFSNSLTVGFASANSFHEAKDFAEHMREELKHSTVSDPQPVH